MIDIITHLDHFHVLRLLLQSEFNIRQYLIFTYCCHNKYDVEFLAPQPTTFGLQQQPQVRFVNPAIQECLDAVNEHQRLKALMKGEWAKGLLPQSSVRADYTVQRIRGLISEIAFSLWKNTF